MVPHRRLTLQNGIRLLVVGIVLISIKMIFSRWHAKDNGILAAPPDGCLIVGSAIVINERAGLSDEYLTGVLTNLLAQRAQFYKDHPKIAERSNNNQSTNQSGDIIITGSGTIRTE